MNFVRVDGYPNYVIHPCGTILRIYKNKTKEVKCTDNGYGYMQIGLCKISKQRHFYIHRLLALHFIHNDDPDNKIEIDHIDAVKDNNNLDNLEWVTRQENMKRRSLNNPPAIITKGRIRKRNDNDSWIWDYCMSKKNKSKSMKSKEDLLKFRKETLIKYNIMV